MTTECTLHTKEQIAAFLPEALKKAIGSYEIYYAAIDHEEADNFATYHKNAKVALAHIELLMKLAKWAEIDLAEHQRDIALFRSEALAETNDYYENEQPEV